MGFEGQIQRTEMIIQAVAPVESMIHSTDASGLILQKVVVASGYLELAPTTPRCCELL